MKTIFLIILFLGSWHAAAGQVQTPVGVEKDILAQIKAIDLPIVYIDTKEGEEPTSSIIAPPEGCIGVGSTDKDYVKGRMSLYDKEQKLFDTGEYKKGKSGLRLRVRGNTSAMIIHKSFKLKFQVESDPLGRTDTLFKSKDWALLNYFSTCDLRTVIGFEVGKLLKMEWEPEWRFVNLVMNGKYRGLYLLCETVGVEPKRVNVDPSGFLIEADPYWWNENPKNGVFKTKRINPAMGYTFKYPKYEADDFGVDEIKAYMDRFEDALYDGKDISRYVDISSFVSWILAHDILGTLDGAGSNMFVLKDDFPEGDLCYQTKLRMGPLWDLGTIFSTPGEWATAHYMTFFYYEQLFKRTDFVREYLRQWEEVRELVGPAVLCFMHQVIRDKGKELDICRRLSPRDPTYKYRSVKADLEEAEKWFEERIPWMDEAVSHLLEQTAIEDIQATAAVRLVEIYQLNGRRCARFEGQQAARLYRQDRTAGMESLQLPAGVYIGRVTKTDGRVESFKYIQR